jgi:hypothetical protein
MKYMLMMHMPADAGADGGMASWSREDLRNHIDFQRRFDQELVDAGEMVVNEGLAFPDQARIVRADDLGTPVVTSSFAEGREFLIGFWLVDVASQERAYEIAARASAAPGPGGVPMGIPIEVRPIAGPPAV